MTANRSETPGGLVRAKRLFAANLILFAALVAVGLFSLGGGSEYGLRFDPAVHPQIHLRHFLG